MLAPQRFHPQTNPPHHRDLITPFYLRVYTAMVGGEGWRTNQIGLLYLFLKVRAGGLPCGKPLARLRSYSRVSPTDDLAVSEASPQEIFIRQVFILMKAIADANL
jgi:hypothetical protein